MAGPAALGLDLGTDEDEFMASATTLFPTTTATFANHQAAMEVETRSTIPTSNSIARHLLGGRTFTLGLPVLSLSSNAIPSTREPPPPREMAGTNRVIRSWLQSLNPFRSASSEDKENVAATPDQTSLPPPTTPEFPLPLEQKSTPDRSDNVEPAPLATEIAHEPTMGALLLGGMTSQPPADETDGDTDTEGFAVRKGGVPRRGRRLVLPKRTSHPSADETETEGDTDNEGFAIPRAPAPGRGPPSRFALPGVPNVYFPEENAPMRRFESPAALDTGSSLGGTPQSIFRQDLPNPDATPEPASPALSQASLASDVVMMLSNNKEFRSWLVDHPQLKRKFDQVDESNLPEAKRQKHWDDYDDEVFSADDSSSAAAEDTPEPEEIPHGPRFASSLESTSSFEPKAVHALIDPLVISEVHINAQYCGPAEKDPDDERDYFQDFAIAAFGLENWIESNRIARQLVADADPEMQKQMNRYRQARKEPKLYRPLEYLANVAMQVGHKEGQQRLMIMNTHDKDMGSTVETRKVDMLAVRLEPHESVPSEPKAVDSQFAIEMKHDKSRNESPPPKLHDHTSSEPPTSSFGKIIRATSSVTLEAIPQTILYAGQLLTSQGPHLRSVLTLLVTWQRVQILVTDRGGTFISVDRDFSGDWSILFNVLIAAQRSDGAFRGYEPSITRLQPLDTSLSPKAFERSKIQVKIGQCRTLATRVHPFALEVESTLNPGQMFSVHAYGANLMGRPAAISEKTAAALVTKALKANAKPEAEPRNLPARPNKAAGSAKTRQGLADESGKVVTSRGSDCPPQFDPESLYGSATVRFECALDGNMDSTCTLQLSWQPASRVSEAVIMLYARQCGIKGVPTLIGWSVLADMDEGLVRSRLYESFLGLSSVRRVHLDLHALVWKEKLMPLWAVTSITSFLGALKSAVTTLDQLHSLGIFHANVGLSTLMVERHDPSQVKLVGFDLAQFQLKECEDTDIETMNHFHQLKAKVDDSASELQLVTPSVAFLPVDKCAELPGSQTRADDFESLFWTTAYILAHHRGGRMITNDASLTDRWYTGNWATIQGAKTAFLETQAKSFTHAEPFAESIGSDGRALAKMMQKWANRLYRPQPLTASYLLSTLNLALNSYSVL